MIEMLDIIGIGAINEDHYLKDGRNIRDLIRRLNLPIETRREAFVPDDKVKEILKDLGQRAFEVRPGGSAFNTIRTIANLKLGLRAGFVGIIGKKDYDLNLRESLKGIDDSLVKDALNKPPSRCIVFGSGNETKLLTAPGSTTDFLSLIDYPILVSYLSRSRWIHLSSFVDISILDFIYRAINDAKQINTSLRVSFDPGHEYTEKGYPQVRDILKITDYLFLNISEFRQLASRDALRIRSGELIRSAKALFDNNPFNGQAIILKSANSNFWIQKDGDSIRIRRYWHRWLPSFIIRDDVGAGDVFSAGVIAGMLSPLYAEFGKGPTRLATALVHAKLRERYGIPLDQLSSIALKQSTYSRAIESYNFRDLMSVYVPPVARYLLAIFGGAVATLIVEAIIKAYFDN